MSTPIPPTVGSASPATPSPTDRIARLQQSTRDLEGVFVEQMFKAMRETVPRDGLVDGGTGEEMFTAMLDQKMASVVPTRWESSLSDALLRQLRGRVEPTEVTAAPPSSPAALTPIINPNALPDASRPEPY